MLYLHVVLLGLVTPGIVGGMIGREMALWRREWKALCAAVVLLVASLAALLIPPLSQESATWRVAAWLSLGPVIVLGWMAVRAAVGTILPGRIGSSGSVRRERVHHG